MKTLLTVARLTTNYGFTGKCSLLQKPDRQISIGQACLQCEERKGVQRNKLVSRHSIVYNRLIERIRLTLVHTFAGWSNLRSFNSFKFSPSDLLCLRSSRSKYNASTINYYLFVFVFYTSTEKFTLFVCYFYDVSYARVWICVETFNCFTFYLLLLLS